MALIETVIETRDAAHLESDEYIEPLFKENRELTEEEETRVADLKGSVERANARIIQIEEDLKRDELVQEARARLGTAAVDAAVITHVQEARTYGPDSGNSYFRDFVLTHPAGMSVDHLNPEAAAERMAQYAREVAGEMRDPNSAEGKHARQALASTAFRESGSDSMVKDSVERTAHFGEQGIELRAGMSTGSTSGGSFVTPQYFVAQYAAYRQFGREFANAANKMPLPDYGVTIYLPQVQNAAGVSAQVGENSGITENDPTAGYLQTSLTTNAGQVTVSQQLLDRAGPDFQFDVMVFDQLQRAYNLTLDTYVLTQALANAGTFQVTNTALYGAASFFNGVAHSKATIKDTAGTVMVPSHVFLQPVNWEYYTVQVDGQDRPQIVPNYAGAFNAIAAGTENMVPEGDTGYKTLSLPVFEDANIPVHSSNNQAIVAAMDEVWFWEGDVVTRTIPQTVAQNLSVLLQLYAYVGCIVRYPTAVQALQGAGLATPSY